jgi:hypothetical protein
VDTFWAELRIFCNEEVINVGKGSMNEVRHLSHWEFWLRESLHLLSNFMLGFILTDLLPLALSLSDSSLDLVKDAVATLFIVQLDDLLHETPCVKKYVTDAERQTGELELHELQRALDRDRKDIQALEERLRDRKDIQALEERLQGLILTVEASGNTGKAALTLATLAAAPGVPFGTVEGRARQASPVATAPKHEIGLVAFFKAKAMEKQRRESERS